MNIARLLLILLASVVCMNAETDEVKSVRLGAEFAEGGFRVKEGEMKYLFIVTITNISDREITVPTRSFDGEPCCWMNSGDGSEAGIDYGVGLHSVGDTIITPSPFRFDPVILAPGESTEFARYVHLSSAGQNLYSFRISLTVDDDFGSKHGWWTGYESVTVDLKKQKPLDGIYGELLK